MLLELVLERLEDAEWVRLEIAGLSEGERALLGAIDALGGEVTGEEVLELEREPVRIAHGGSVQVPVAAPYSAWRGAAWCSRVPRAGSFPMRWSESWARAPHARAASNGSVCSMSRHVHEPTPARASLPRRPDRSRWP